MIHIIGIESNKSNKLFGLRNLNPPALLGFANSCGSIGLLFSSTRTANMNTNTSNGAYITVTSSISWQFENYKVSISYLNW